MGVQKGWQADQLITLDQIISSSFFYLEKWSPNTKNAVIFAAFFVFAVSTGFLFSGVPKTAVLSAIQHGGLPLAYAHVICIRRGR